MSLRAVLTCLPVCGAAQAGPVKLRCDYLDNPLGIDSEAPRLSWQSDSLARNWRQTAYQILVASIAYGGPP
jgi:alpha-L-rhamnosidase